MQTLKTYLISNEIIRVEEGLTTVRNLMNYSSECLKYLTDFNIFFYVVKLLSPVSPAGILEKAAWIISDYLATDESKKIVDINLACSLITCLTPGDSYINQHLLWALGNLAAEEDFQRSLIEKTGIIESLPPYIEGFSKTIAWLLSNLTKGVEHMKKDQFQSICNYVKQLENQTDSEIRSEVTETLANLSSVDDIELVQLIVDEGLVQRVVQDMHSENFSLRTAGLKFLGNICAVSHEHTQLVLNLNTLDLLNHSSFLSSSLSSDVMWILSNISAGTKSQITKLITHKIFESLIMSIAHYDMKTKTQAVIALKNLLKAEESSKEFLLKLDVFNVISVALRETDAEYCRVLLEVCHVLFGEKECLKLIEETGCIYSLDSLSMHKNKVISESAEEIINTLTVVNKTEVL
jgi:hypothetical protein